jgi:hypothetical protein
MRIRLLAVFALVTSLSGCAAGSSTRVTAQSIVALRSHFNLIQNPGFADLGHAWRVYAPSAVVTTVTKEGDQRVLTITNGVAPVTGAVLVFQQPALLPALTPGSTYVLRMQIRAAHLSRAVRTELKLNYAGGGYAFFAASRVGSADGSQTVSGTTPGWITVEARATAALPLNSVQVYAVDSSPTPGFSGSISLANPQLFVAPGGPVVRSAR